MSNDDLDEKALEAATRAICERRFHSFSRMGGFFEHDARAAITAYLSALPERELLREALSALDHLTADLEALHKSGAILDPPPTEHEIANLRRARAAADKIRAAMEHQQKGEKL